MINRAFVRVLLTSAALATSALLAGCNSDQVSLAQNAKANQPVPPKLVAAMGEKNMDLQSPILIRLFKQEAELEVWKQDRSGKFGLLKSYPICRWSGDLGPKVREGDRQAPEGFYSISPAQMNPQSAYYLSFNTGYPNAYDKSLGHTGSELMVHGDCSSRGCYAMTDEQIAEIYSLGRESFFGGQRAFQFQAYPFRMTAVNMAKHRNNPNMPFWRMIKEGYDHFEVTRQEPKVDFCEHKYVFDAEKPPGATRDPVFDASAKCPAYVVPDEIANAVREKEQADEAEFAKLIAKGTPVAKLNTGIDGGMNSVFASRVPGASTGLSEPGEAPGLSLTQFSPLPGTIPGHVNPPRAPSADEIATAAAPEPASVGSTTPRVAAVSAPEKASLISNLRKISSSGAIAANAAAVTSKPVESKPAPKAVAAKSAEAKPNVIRQAAARPPFKPSATTEAASAAAPAPAPQQTALVAGSAPIMSTNSFDSRFSAVK
ncbi:MULTISPECIES: murein L,D-transpeptidase family protein [unclassified Bradyrhizobium]|uniref:murein L,D-transpeptidase family protein n=1 Tax=unclassified Bradyrhizobium TaxID=2631580 RepID=UPI0028EA3683|nr:MULTISPECIES: murein L,D-transpeptidase family protein [unclassified Bradyrhizobium]